MSALAGPLVLVGCGKMGRALLDGWLAGGLDAREVFVVEPDPALRSDVRAVTGVQAVAEPKELPAELAPRALVLAVKPQVMDAVLPAYDPVVRRGAAVLSIAAGKTIAGFERAYGPGAAVVRAMPNTPAAIGRGASVLVANAKASAAQRALCEALMAAVGLALWVEDEEPMHAVTAMSGGGPAYVFLLIETLARAGVHAGLPEDLAERLAHATVTGAAELAAVSDDPPATLRANVTSPGGTTQKALEVLMANDGLQPLFDRAIAAAAERSRELA